MMFKVGDKVRLKKEFLDYRYWSTGTDTFTVKQICPGNSLILQGLTIHYDANAFELVKAVDDIDTTNRYETLAGEPVRVLAVDMNSADFPIIIAVEGYETIGRLCEGVGGAHLEQFIRKSIAYTEFKINDKVLVSDNGRDWVKGHFAGLSNDGRPQTFSFGKTQFTTDGSKNTWRECRVYNEEN